MLDFDIEIRAYPSVLDVNHIVSGIDEKKLDNDNLKKMAEDYKKMISTISENILYNTTIFIIYHEKHFSQKEPENFDDIKRELEERAEIITSGLYSMGFSAKILNSQDILKMLKDIYAGVKIVGVPVT